MQIAIKMLYSTVNSAVILLKFANNLFGKKWHLKFAFFAEAGLCTDCNATAHSARMFSTHNVVPVTSAHLSSHKKV